MSLTLFFAPGACSRVPLIALEETGAAFDTSLIAFMRGDHRAPHFLAISPAGKVPTLLADGVGLAQNAAILTYLARRFPAARLMPFTGDPMNDAQLLAWLAWFSGDLHPLVTRIRMPQLICDQADAAGRVKAGAMAAMAFQLATVEQLLGRQPWLLGDQWSVLDGYLFWVWFRITGAGFDEAGFPAIARHHALMHERPAVRRALAREAAAEAELGALGLSVPLPSIEATL